MGYYINPANESKEAFLDREGMEMITPTEPGSDEVLVCLVNNGMFTAAAVIYNQRELEDFTEPGDARPRSWYAVKRDKILAVHPEFERVLVQ